MVLKDVNPEIGNAVLHAALCRVQAMFGGRLVAAYALGSLAHGGFSSHVSDVDLGLVLADPLGAADAEAIASLNAGVKVTGLPLADRLSLFWGSPESLAGVTEGGRYPPVDCLDLIENGRLLAGRDIRAMVKRPTTVSMVLSAAAMSLKNMATPQVVAELREPAGLIRAGVRPLTKRVLFPVRFLYTARTGCVGTNDAAVEHLLSVEGGPAADLARQAYAWRSAPYAAEDPGVARVVRAGLLPLYRLYAEDYAPRLEAAGEAAMAQAMREWHARLQ